MDYHPTEEDEYRIEHPSVGRSAKDNREVQGNDTGRACFPHAEQYHLQQDTERDRQAVRFQGAFDLSHGKTLPKFFPIENKRLTKNCFLIGNDLETSEVPYLTLFCIKSKERWLQMQR